MKSTYMYEILFMKSTNMNDNSGSLYEEEHFMQHLKGKIMTFQISCLFCMFFLVFENICQITSKSVITTLKENTSKLRGINYCSFTEKRFSDFML